jgi:hypothetical protein
MKLLPLVALAFAALAADAAAAGFQKPYYGATRAGTFARQKATDEKGAVTEYVYSRLADVGTDRVIELAYKMLSGQFKGTNSTTTCLVPADFALESDAVDFMAHSRRCASSSDGGAVTEYPRETMKAIAQGMTNYAAIVSFKGTEAVAGKPCDRYAYEYKGHYMNVPVTVTGDMWLSDTVPFGLVKEVMSQRDAGGKTLTRIETVLVESGEGATSALPRWSWAPPAKRKPRAKPNRAAH